MFPIFWSFPASFQFPILPFLMISNFFPMFRVLFWKRDSKKKKKLKTFPDYRVHVFFTNYLKTKNSWAMHNSSGFNGFTRRDPKYSCFSSSFLSSSNKTWNVSTISCFSTSVKWSWAFEDLFVKFEKNISRCATDANTRSQNHNATYLINSGFLVTFSTPRFVLQNSNSFCIAVRGVLDELTVWCLLWLTFYWEMGSTIFFFTSKEIQVYPLILL